MRCDRFTEFLRGVALEDSLGTLPENLNQRQVVWRLASAYTIPHKNH